jgi:hypothetical protein
LTSAPRSMRKRAASRKPYSAAKWSKVAPRSVNSRTTTSDATPPFFERFPATRPSEEDRNYGISEVLKHHADGMSVDAKRPLVH